MSSLDSLKPCSGAHSIKEATVTFFLVSKIMRPDAYQALLSGALRDRYQQFSPASQVQMKIGPIPTIINSELKVANNTGFKMVGFDAGQTSNAILGQNEFNRFFFSFHSLKYKGWTEFIDGVIGDAREISKVEPKFILAYSLQYLDEFVWEDNRSYDAKLFFRKSEYLPNDIFDSSILEYSLSLDKKYKDRVYLDRIAVNVNDQINRNKLITVIHNMTFVLKESELLPFDVLLGSSAFKENMDYAHNVNKDTLKAILTDEVCKKICLI